MSSTPIVFVTTNSTKLHQVNRILSSTSSLVIKSVNLNLPEIQGTTREVARDKCSRAAEAIGGPCIIEDTALCCDALGGLPGPYIKDFFQGLGNDGLNTLLKGFQTTTAHALCTFAYSGGPDCEPVLFEGRTEGKIVHARGMNVFSWNSIFEVEGTGKTFAEMEVEEKMPFSHRYRALVKLRRYLESMDV
ncbi:hypothetical protein JAAARDRAFT_63979 [Jaapia argillacea MUCL 33604]|uniref:Inosine triphosphate pyrophosphatase n=1 Tax=Jaapia argillacea MUCL 33604 TaxID=933084 RepID=A0A067QAH0_9AGAM|nr:hypothetical protein JAAARDRAFT_63979 [Jaapia argillacea MUCL 33604]